MIDVLTMQAGTVRDRAEADTPEAAVVAARTLLRDATTAGFDGVTASFYVEGRLVRASVTPRDLTDWATLA